MECARHTLTRTFCTSSSSNDKHTQCSVRNLTWIHALMVPQVTWVVLTELGLYGLDGHLAPACENTALSFVCHN